MATPKQGETVYDALTAFLGGVNSGLNPILLRRDQLAFATNATIRGGFISPRPPYRKITLDFNADTALQEAFETGFYQGGTTYRPDFGNHSLLAAISGRLFKLVISGNTATVTDVSVPGDPNPPLTTQAWLWQGEKWVIWNNGLNLPVFYDGVSSRRSNGPSVFIATVSAISPGTPPDIGATVDATLTAPYTGPFGIAVQMNGALYEVKEVTGGSPNNAILTNIHATVGATMPAGSQVSVIPSRVGVIISSDRSAPTAPPSWTTVNAVLSSVDGLSVGTQVVFNVNDPVGGVFPHTFAVTSVDTTTKAVSFSSADGFQYGFGIRVQDGNIVTLAGSSNPNVILGTLVSSIVNPAVGGTVGIQLSPAAYSGPTGQTVWIQNEQYTIAPQAAAAPGAGITLINLSDTSALAYTLPMDITSVPEFPVGRMGAYGMGRNWMSLVDGISFIAGNIVGGEGGTVAQNYRDSVLAITENDYLNGGGTFRLPGSGDVITAMTFTTTLDTSLGQGPLQVFTASSAFSVNAPVDRLTWQTLTFPVLTESLIGIGALAQQSLFPVNSDSFFRSLVGWYSLIQARRSISEQWGNTPMTREMERVLNQEDKTLLPWVSGCQFDNRALFTAVPQTTGQGVPSTGIVAMNLDPFSSLAGKAPPVYDGLWRNLNPLQLLRAVIDSADRAFAFNFNATERKIELWELLDTAAVGNAYSIQSERILFDNDGTTDTRIEWSFETAVMLKEVPGTPMLMLEGGEMYVEDVVGEVDVTVQYRPDSYPCFKDWIKFSLCAEQSTDTTDNLKPGYKSKAGFGSPAYVCDEYTETDLRFGHRYQLRFVFRGHLRFLGCKIGASVKPELPLAKPVCRPQGSTPQP